MTGASVMPFMRFGFLLLGILFVFGGIEASAQKRNRLDLPYQQSKEADQKKGAAVLADFRGKGIAGDYYLEFTLRHTPRKGDVVEVQGKLYGSRDVNGPVSLLELGSVSAEEGVERYLIRSGINPEVWQMKNGTKPEKVEGKGLLAALAGTEVSLFDLQLQFFYWQDFVYEGLIRYKGRPTHVFLLSPPNSDTYLDLPLSGVRIYLDSRFNALRKAELIGEDEKVFKSVSLISLKKIDEQWIPKRVDMRDDLSRDKTRMKFTVADLDVR
ncbi:MAG: outer membrane lipoprotein-sorting protein, partial [Opitutaceae bacterium]|nr:outer membrane lipoprotein-sorting protein [Opitutaceae bacterium]